MPCTNAVPRRIASLLLPLPTDHDDAGACSEVLWSALIQVVDPVLRKAFAHVHNCKCDVPTHPP